jgi:hypothetical protein
MNPIACLLAGLALVAGCQRSSGTTAAVSPNYRDDIARLCDVVVQSGADRMPLGERALPIANWLATHLETAERTTT